jgi:hypothetical protein
MSLSLLSITELSDQAEHVVAVVGWKSRIGGDSRPQQFQKSTVQGKGRVEAAGKPVRYLHGSPDCYSGDLRGSSADITERFILFINIIQLLNLGEYLPRPCWVARC